MEDWMAGEPRPYRKRPVVIEAARLGEFNGGGVAAWCGGVLRGGPDGGSRNGHVIIKTPEGTMTASPGDYVIKGVQGEFYPCKPDIFEATYEAVEEPTS
jgi:hypothetical protein